MNSTRNINFEHEPLNIANNEVRLICLFPSRSKAANIECSLIHKSLGDPNTAYEALSYTWDGNLLEKSIILDKIKFPVTKNLEAALRALRTEEEDRFLWADAICINQEDVLEKNREVLRMVQIYRNAWRVLVWLGQETDATSLAVRHLQQLQEQYHRSESRHISARFLSALKSMISSGDLLLRTAFSQLRLNWLHACPLLIAIYCIYSQELLNFNTGTTWGWLISASYLPLPLLAFFKLFPGSIQSFYHAAERQAQANSPDDAVVAALEDFFGRKWFTRVWIVQEVAAARDVIVICGSYELSWETLRHACRQISQLTAKSRVRHAYSHTGFQRLSHIISSLNPEDVSRGLGYLGARSLLYLLFRFNICEATERHDKVYGLLGMADEIRNPTSGIAAIEPRYDESPQRTYCVVTKFLIETSTTLRVFRACQGSRTLEDLPSWVPDWSTTAWRDVHGITDPYRLEKEDSSMSVAEFSDDLRTVKLQGFVIAHLSGLRVVTDVHEEDVERFFLHLLEKFVILFGLVYRLRLTWEFGHFITKALVSVSPELQWTHDFFELYREAYYDGYFAALKDIPATLNNDVSPMACHEEVSVKRFFIEPIPELSLLQGANCATTVADAQYGDTLCMMIGADCPFILRENGENWILRGSAHLFLPPEPFWNRCVQLHTAGNLALKSFIVQ